MKQCCANCKWAKPRRPYSFYAFFCTWKPEKHPPWLGREWRTASSGKTCKCWQEKK